MKKTSDKAQSLDISGLLSIVLDAIPIPVFCKDRDRRYVGVNKAFEKFFAATNEQLIGKTVFDINPPELAKAADTKDGELYQSGTAQRYECQLRDAGGSMRDVIVDKAALTDERGNISGLIGTILDITERKRIESEYMSNLRFLESMDKINRLMQQADDLEKMMSDVLDALISIFKCDRAWLIYPCDPDTPSWRAPMERTRPEFPGVHATERVLPTDSDMAFVFRAVLAAKGPITMSPGSKHPVPEKAKMHGIQSQISMALYPRVGKPYLFGLHQCSYPRDWTADEVQLFNEIGRRLADGLTGLLMHRNLRQSESKLEDAERVAHIGYWDRDFDTDSVTLSEEACRIYGLDPKERIFALTDWRERWLALIHPEDRERTINTETQAAQGGSRLEVEYRVIRPDGQVRMVRSCTETMKNEWGRVKRMFGTIQDITDKVVLETRLRQSQKMEAVGRLAGGVAHDFNNMLGVIIGNTELVIKRLSKDHPLHSNLKEISLAAERSAELTRQLLAFARKQTVVPKVLDLNSTVEGMLKMLERLIGEQIELEWRPGSDLWPVKMDPSQIDQILVNLCVNARDSISGTGKITIETENATLNEAYCAEHPEFSPGEYVVLAVGDDGCGMDKETLNKLFEPFFSTKDKGKGTGLGLSTVYGIVDQNNGIINVYSEPGLGTIFRIFMARHEADFQTAQKPKSEIPAAPGRETILLVEDEPLLLGMATQILQTFGYRVLAASTADEALGLAMENAGGINLLVVDVVMPGMNGLELAKKITPASPGIKHLFMSGYAGNILAEQGVLDDEIDFIQKPFSMQTLAAKVREVLDGS